MADRRPPRDVDERPRARPCPNHADASPLEILYWRHLEEIRFDIADAQADRGHTAVVASRREARLTAELYHAARAARIAEADLAKSRGDVAGRIVSAFAKMPPALQDEVHTGIVAILAER